MAFRIKFSATADRNANEILEWLVEEHAGDTGYRWFMSMREAIKSLDNMPKRCALAPESAEFPFEVRQLLYGRKPHVYRVLFTIEAETVTILHIRRPRQQQLRP
jgi:plasmid stabilization system protein ParE